MPSREINWESINLAPFPKCQIGTLKWHFESYSTTNVPHLQLSNGVSDNSSTPLSDAS
jgi:hypothetical protein